MRLVYPVTWARPSRRACEEQTIATVAALARRGHEVTLLAPRGPSDPALTPEDLRAWFGVDGEFRLVQRASRWAGESVARSLLWLRQALREPPVREAEILLSRIPAMLALGGVSPVPFVTDHYRRWPDDLPAIRPLLRRTARHRDCLGFVLHSELAAASFRRAGVADDCILVARNGADVARFDIGLDSNEARRRLGLPADRAIAVYAGRINAGKGLDQLLALADLRPEVLFLLVGSEGRDPIEQDAAARANVRVLPWATPDVLPAWLLAADVLLIPPSLAPLERFRNAVLPLKLFAYLAAGRPILAPDTPDIGELLAHECNALLVVPDRPAAAAAALDRLLGDPGLAHGLGEGARRTAMELSWDARAERITHFLEERLAQRSLNSRIVSAPSVKITGAVQAPTIGGR